MMMRIEEVYTSYTQDFNEKIKECKSVTEMLHTYAKYTGKLQAVLDCICIEERYK